MTPQEAFDKSVRGLASQGFHRAMATTDSGSSACSYLDAKGQRCAVGWLIEDILLQPKEVTRDIEWLCAHNAQVAERFSALDVSFLYSLQRCHDRACHEIGFQSDEPAKMVRLLRSFAVARGLSLAVFDEPDVAKAIVTAEAPQATEKQWYVVYQVAGFEGEQRVGPWPLNEAFQQRNDIEGYEGVSNVRLLDASTVKS